MTTSMMAIFGGIVTFIGSIFLLLGALGILRMPDAYNRMQAGTKATTLGTILFLVGIAVGHSECGCLGKIVLLIIFVVITNPVSSNTLARAAHYIGNKLADSTVKDDLADTSIDEEGDTK